MNDKLIRQLQEEELFPSASPEEVAQRQANKPLPILQGAELEDMVKDTLCSFLVDRIDKSDLSDYFMNGASLSHTGHVGPDDPIGEMELSRAIDMLLAVSSHRRTRPGIPQDRDLDLLDLISMKTGQKYSKIDWSEHGQ
jgi:hypothetical protein